MPMYSIGVDLGGTNLRIAAVDREGIMLEKVTLDTQVTRGREHVVNDMCEAIQQLSGKIRGASSLLGIGIGVPGIIDMESGMVRESPNLPDWADYPARTEIEKRLSTRVILENDANAAALGEKWLGAARDFGDMGMLTLGTGVGGGLVLGGRIWHGMNGMANEFGHITVDPEGALCGCGNRGCLEAYASATAVVRMAHEAVANGNAPGLASAARSNGDFTAKALFDLATQGDEQARQVFRKVGKMLGIALSDLVNALNLPIYVVGGGVSAAWEIFSPTVFEELRLRSMVYAATAPDFAGGPCAGASAHVKPLGPRKTIVTRALLGSDAGLYGAARLPMTLLET